MTKTAYLDRDGTINRDVHYLTDPTQLEFLPGAVRGMREMLRLGYRLIVITNQSAVGRGMLDAAGLERIHNELQRRLEARGVHLTAIYACPHAPWEKCDCRKPLPGLIRKAEAEHGETSGVMIGDSTRDMEAGKAAGLMTILIQPGGVAMSPNAKCDLTARDLADAAEILRKL